MLQNESPASAKGRNGKILRGRTCVFAKGHNDSIDATVALSGRQSIFHDRLWTPNERSDPPVYKIDERGEARPLRKFIDPYPAAANFGEWTAAPLQFT